MRNLILISENQLPEKNVFGRDISLKHYRKYLGKNLTDCYYDASQGLYPNAIAAISGAIQDNHHLYLYLPEQYNAIDPDHLRMIDDGINPDQCRHHFNQRLIRIVQQGIKLNTAVTNSSTIEIRTTKNQIYIGKRGRGKSTALREKVSWLISQKIAPIIIISPYRENRQQFELLKLSEKAQVIFAAPDRILANKSEAAYLIIDEAAALPSGQLISLIREYPNFTIASTEDGYEGSANEFRVKTLRHDSFRNAELVYFTQSHRFNSNDPLESSINRIFLIDNQQIISPHAGARLQIQKVDISALAGNEQLLEKIWYLLRQAHYRNRPEDLKRLLDLPLQSLYAAALGENIVGVLHVIEETRITDDDLITNIIAGRRRPRGRLLMQQLLIRTRQAVWARQSMHRIQRIAVHEKYRRNKIASKLLSAALKDISGSVGAAFQETQELKIFWGKVGFHEIEKNHESKTCLFIRPNNI